MYIPLTTVLSFNHIIIIISIFTLTYFRILNTRYLELHHYVNDIYHYSFTSY